MSTPRIRCVVIFLLLFVTLSSHYSLGRLYCAKCSERKTEKRLRIFCSINMHLPSSLIEYVNMPDTLVTMQQHGMNSVQLACDNRCESGQPNLVPRLVTMGVDINNIDKVDHSAAMSSF